MMKTAFEQFQNLVWQRRTVKKFDSTPLLQEEVEALVELMRWAPNHRLTQPWRVYALSPQRILAWIEHLQKTTSPEEFDGLQGAIRRVQTAGAVLHITSLRNAENPTIEKENYAAVCAGVQNLLLGAECLGYTSFWSTGKLASHVETAQFLEINSEQEDFVGSLWLGKNEKPKAPARKPLEHYLRWA